MSMSSQAISPFDSIVPTKCGEPLRLVIASDSIFLRNIDTHMVTNLCECTQFSEVSLIFTPSTDASVLHLLEPYNANIISFTDSSNGFEFQVESTHYFFRNRMGLSDSGIITDKIPYSQISYGEKALNLLILDNKIADYFVVAEDDYSAFSNNSKLITPHMALELIRLFMVKLEKFYIRRNFIIDETGYYWYRVESLFYSFRRVWSDSVGNKNLERWLSSLLDRFEFFCRAIDSIKLEALRQPNNITSSRIQYHFTYLAVSIPGIYDNIAQYLNIKFDLQISNALKIVLKKSEKELSSNADSIFISALRSKCENLAQYIAQNDVQRKMQLIYPIRDGFVHKDQITSALYMDASSKVKINSFFASNELYDKVVALQECGYNYLSCFLVSNSKIKLIDPVKFISILEEITIEIVNTILSLIPTDKEMSTWSYVDDMFHGKKPIYF